MIPRTVIDEIVFRNNIEQVIGSYVTLKRAGSNFNGLCPFHSEKTPSFTVFPSTGSFYCFGCGAGGDVITFIMKAENVDYVSALEILAQRAGITIPRDTSDAPEGIPRKRIYEMNVEAARFFRNCLYDEKLGGDGLRYLTEERGLSSATLRHFGLGFSPNHPGMLTSHMHSLGYSDEELISGFLCGKSQKTGRAYDYFRNRVIFPIIDTSGNVVAFGGRVMDDSKPKYLNTSDTPAFKKRHHLFALNFAKSHASEQMILCEGYMDVIALHAAGFENAVATLGTAITSDQARIFAKYTKKVIITYDSDSAGQTAADKAMRLLAEVGVEVRVLKLSGAKDPDEYIRKFGADSFRRVLNDSQSGFEYRLSKILSGYDLSVASDKIRVSADVCNLISDVYSGVEREIYISSASKRLGLTPEALKNDVERIRRRKIKDYNHRQSVEAYNTAKNFRDTVNPDAAKNIRANAAEETVLGLMLLYDEHRKAVASGQAGLGEEDFSTEFGRRVFRELCSLENSESGFSKAMLGQSFSIEEMGRIESMAQKRRVLANNGADVLAEGIRSMKREKEAASGDRSLQSVLEKRRLELKKEKSKNT